MAASTAATAAVPVAFVVTVGDLAFLVSSDRARVQQATARCDAVLMMIKAAFAFDIVCCTSRCCAAMTARKSTTYLDRLGTPTSPHSRKGCAMPAVTADGPLAFKLPDITSLSSPACVHGLHARKLKKL